MLFNSALAGAGVVGVSSKVKKDSNAVAEIAQPVENPEFPGDQS
jgi:hypothetical protein